MGKKKNHENLQLRINMIRKGKNQITSELAFLAQKPQNKLFIWKDKERLQEETKYKMGKKKMKGLEREKVSV